MTEVEALQAALAGEHAAVYGYGVVGAHLGGRRRAAAESAYAGHRARRDQLRSLLLDRGEQPVAPAAGYQLPAAVASVADAVALATTIEERVGAVWLDVVAAAPPRQRELAARAVQDAAVRAAGWRGSSEPFPGLGGAPG